MKLTEKIRNIHLIGCAGAGTLPLARIFLELGYTCSGSDLLSTPGTDLLSQLGLSFHSGHRTENLPAEYNSENSLLVYTSAAAEDNPELVEAKKRGVECLRRGEALARIGKAFPHSMAVCGSHGKTSVTSLSAHALRKLGYDPGFLIGGAVCGWETSGTAGSKQFFVTEVDESDSTNALFHSEVAVITNIEDDHAWSVGGVEALYESFVKLAANAEKLVYVASPVPDRLFAGFQNVVRIDSATLPDWDFPVNWGRFQRLNAVTAFYGIKALIPEIADSDLISALLSFPGVERRMSLRFENEKFRLIEDYAHHPTELKASLEALRETNPGYRLVVVFQPHRYARLQRYLEDFTSVLKTADHVFVTPVFAAWTAASNVDSGTLVSEIGSTAELVTGSWKSVAEKVLSEIKKGDLIAVIGAGDIRFVIPEIIAAAKKA